jgi:hypothetical protein
MTFLYCGLGDKPHLLTFVKACAVGHTVIACFHSVTGQLQMLAGIIVNIVKLILEFHHMVSGGLLLVMESSR